MTNLVVRLIERTALAALALLAIATVAGVFWTAGVHGRWGDLLLGVHPGQVRVGWSQDWSNAKGWAHLRAERSRTPFALAFLGGQTFTTAAPHEIAIDVPVWLAAAPLVVITAVARRRRRLAALPRVPSCAACGYPVGASVRCTECGAPLARSEP